MAETMRGEFNEHLIPGIVAEAVVDFFKVVGVDEIENDVAIRRCARGRAQCNAGWPG